jgi:hypothetical protein
MPDRAPIEHVLDDDERAAFDAIEDIFDRATGTCSPRRRPRSRPRSIAGTGVSALVALDDPGRSVPAHSAVRSAQNAAA